MTGGLSEIRLGVLDQAAEITAAFFLIPRQAAINIVHVDGSGVALTAITWMPD
jgi:hypothetical protein